MAKILNIFAIFFLIWKMVAIAYEIFDPVYVIFLLEYGEDD